MEWIALLFGGMAGLIGAVALFAIFLTWVVLFEQLSGVSRQLGRLQRRLSELEEAERGTAVELSPDRMELLPEQPDLSEAITLEAPKEPAPVEPASPEPMVAKRAPAAPFQLPSPERIAVFLAAGTGGLALLVGGLFALVAVLESGLLLPSVRVCIGLLAGTLLWVVGAVLRGRVRGVPSALEGAGMGVSYGALFAAHGFYDLLGPGTTFVLMAAVSAVAAMRAAVHRDRAMAWLGLIGGLLSPVLVSTGDNGAVGLFAYLFVVLLGTVGIAGWRRWPELVVGSALGAGALYLGWTTAWYGVDSVWIALLAAFGLQIPFAATAALVGTREEESRALRLGLISSAVAGAALFPLLALPWLYALDTSFTDPRSGLSIIQEGGPIRVLGAVALSMLPVPLWVAGRVRRQALIAGVPSLLTGLLTLVWASSWSYAQGADPLWLAACIAPLAVGLVLHLGDRRTGVGLLFTLPAIGLVLFSAPALELSGGAFAAAVVAVVLLCAIGAYVAAPGALSMGAVLVLALPLVMGALMSDTLGSTWVLGATLITLGGLSAPSLLRRWSDDYLPSLPWLGALLVGPAVFPALYLLWESELGTDWIGLLPLLLGAHGLLAAAVLVRGHGQARNSTLLALAVAIALLGVTFALPVQFQEKWLTVGWALEGLALAGLARWVRHPLLRWGSVLLGLTIGVRLLINPYALAYGDAAGWPILNWTLYTWGIPSLTLVGSAYLIDRTRPQSGTDWLGWAPMSLSILAMFTGFALVNVEVSHMFQDAGPVELGGSTLLQGMVRSLAWAGWGMFLLIAGMVAKSRVTRFIGFAFLMLAAAKVFIYDIWTLPGFVRVGSFIGLGVLLIFSALLFGRVVLRAPDRSEPEGA